MTGHDDHEPAALDHDSTEPDIAEVDQTGPDEQAAEPRSPGAGRARALLAPLARLVVVGGAVAALVAAAGSTSAEVSLGADTESAASAAREVAANDALLACPGAPLSGTDRVASQRVRSQYVARSAPERAIQQIVPANQAAGTIDISAPRTSRPIATSSTDIARGASEAAGVLVTAKGGRAAGLVASQLTIASTETARGLALAPCTAPSTESWIVVGGDAPGRQERLIVVNPGDNPVSVRLTAYRGDGMKERVGGEDTVIPPNERRSLLLDGLVGTDGVQVVRVQAEGSAVGVSAVDTWLDGVTPRGISYATPTAAPTKRLVIAAVPGGAQTRLVLAAPGDEDAVVTVRALRDGEPSRVDVATVTRGSSATVPIKEMSGVRGFLIESDVPVVASAESIGGDRGGDISWSSATAPIAELAGLATSPSIDGTALTRTLTLAASPEAASVELTTVVDGEPQTRTIEVPSDRAVTVELEQAEGVWVRPNGGGDVYASVVMAGRDKSGRALSEVVPLVPARVLVQEVELNAVP